MSRFLGWWACRMARSLALTLLAGTAFADEGFFLDLDTGGHRAFVKDLVFTPNGEFLVSASDDKTIRVWDWQSGLSLKTLRGEIGPGNDGKIFAVAVSPDNRTIAAAGYFGPGLGETPPYGDVRLFDLASGRMTGVLHGPEFANYDVAFSPDGKMLAAGGQDGFVYLWRQDTADTGAWIEHARLDADSTHISQIAFAGAGSRLVATTTDNGIRLWDLATEEEVAVEGAEALRDVSVPALAVSPDGSRFAIGNAEGRVELFQAKDGSAAAALPNQSFYVGALSFADSGGEHLIVSCGYRCTDRHGSAVWKVGGEKPLRDYRGLDGIVLASAVTPDGRRIATTGGTRHAIDIWDPTTGETSRQLVGRGRPVTAVGADPKSMQIAWGTENPCPERDACPETLGSLATLLALPSEERYFEHPEALVGDSSRFRRSTHSAGSWTLKAAAGGSSDLQNAVLEILSGGQVLHRIENDATNGYLHAAFTLTDNGRTVITGGNDGTLLEYESQTGGLAGAFSGGHTGEVHAMTALEAQGLLLTGSADQTLKLWNLKTRELIASFYFDETDWVAWMPQGYYYASDNGDERFGWHVNQGKDREARFVRAGQLKTFLWSPEIVRRAIILKSARAAVAEMRPGAEGELDRLLKRKPPEFDIKVAEDQSGVREGFVAIEVIGAAEAETGLTEFSILSNSRNVGEATSRAITGDGKRTILQVPVGEGENEISITGVNKEGYLTERSVAVLGKAKRQQAKRGKLYAAVIGVNKYPFLPDACNGRPCDLKYPVDDATAFLDMLSKKTAPLFSGMETLVMVNGDSLESSDATTSTIAGLDRSLEPESDTISDELEDFLDKPGPDDTTIVFVAGHGINIDEDYYFIPTDGRKQDGERWKRSSLVDWSDVQKAVERAKGVRFMMLDTCHAANAFNPRLEKDAADARVIVFSATAANNTAQERADLGHGVFTYTLLKGLGGAAKTSDEGVTLFGLADYVGQQVAELTARQQKPFYYVGGAENLLIAQP